ncbi:MAG: OmpP1/FadL family transporter [Woeseiaceae bacterium]
MVKRVERLSSHGKAFALLLVLLLPPANVSAQEGVVPLQFSFSDPGARSMGLGGAFVALADDATAAFANPAGLVQLVRPEISIEARSWSYSTPYTVGGRAEGLPSGTGIDTMVGVRTATSEYDANGLSFLSFTYPRGNWSLALYRHEYADLEFSGATQGLFGGGTDCCQTRLHDQRWATDMDITSYGLSAAYRISDSFYVGLGAIYYDASLEARTTEYRWDEESTESFFAPNSYLPERSVLNETVGFDDSDWGIAGGFLWRLSKNWSIGGIYRPGIEVDLGVRLTAGEATDFGVPPGGVIFEATGIATEFPDFFGLGFAYQGADGRLTVSFQWDRVEYSDIPTSIPLDNQAMDDADELHLGAEYVFLGSTPIIAVRLGAWLEPDHQIHATTDDPFTSALLPRGDDDMHYSAGIGIAMQRFQIDAAMDFADRLDTVSLSAIFNF